MCVCIRACVHVCMYAFITQYSGGLMRRLYVDAMAMQ